MKWSTEVKAILLFTLLFFYVALKLTHKPEKVKRTLHAMVFEVNDGYGYLILDKDKVLIKQDFIPAIEGGKSFSSYDDARLVANLVRDKLLKGDSPVVSAQELYDLNIATLKPY